MPSSETTKLLFLDIDGVLLTRRSISAGGEADAECVKALNALSEASAASIVLSSTWRLRGLPTMRQYFKLWGINGEIVGTTPDLYHLYCGERHSHPSIHEANDRTEEIQMWIDCYPAHLPRISGIVILDDDAIAGDLAEWHVRTEFTYGLTMAHVEQAMAILERQEMRPD